MNDQDLAAAVNAYLVAHPHASRAELRRKLNTSERRMEKLCSEGLIKTLPAKMNASIAATLNRKRNNIFSGWTIKPRGQNNG